MAAGEVFGTPPTGSEHPAGAQSREGGPAWPQLTAALPIAVDLSAERADAVRSWVEGMLGWQVVDGSDADPVPAVLLLRDHRDLRPAGVSGSAPDPASIVELSADAPRSVEAAAVTDPAAGPADRDPGLPTVLLLPDGSDPVQAAATAARLGPAAVLGWPSDRDRLPAVAAGLLEVPRRREGSPARLIVGGSAGGVGTTTVTLALAGLRAWSGTRTLAAVRGLGSGHRGVPTAALGGGDLWAAAERVPGIDALRAIRLVDHGMIPEITDPAIEAVLLDLGPDPDCDVLVCRPDAAGLAALAVTTAAAIVLVGDGAVPGRALMSAAAGRPVLRVPWSARVARAGATGRVPAGLPGSWVAGLRPLLARSGVARVPARSGREARRRPPAGTAGSVAHRPRPG